MTMTIGGTSGLVFPDSSTQNTAATGFGFKNRLINGSMMIDQRNAGASVAGNDGAFPADRWMMFHQSGSGSKGNVQQNQGSVTPPAGFVNYIGFTTTSAYSVAAGDGYAFQQRIEGYNVADLGWGTASASTITLSFWVRSSLTGTFGGSLRNQAGNRSYPFSYTINSANTWEQKSITVAGDTTGTWLTTNGIGIYLSFGLGVGSTYSGSAGAWAASNFWSATGATSVVGTNGATFYITGVQLEKGSTATSFDYRPYGTEFLLCQRYFQTTKASSGYGVFAVSTAATTSAFIAATALLPVTMRASPTLTWFDKNGDSGKVTAITSNSSFSGTSTPVYDSSSTVGNGVYVFVALYGTTAYGLRADYTASAEL